MVFFHFFVLLGEAEMQVNLVVTYFLFSLKNSSFEVWWNHFPSGKKRDIINLVLKSSFAVTSSLNGKPTKEQSNIFAHSLWGNRLCPLAYIFSLLTFSTDLHQHGDGNRDAHSHFPLKTEAAPRSSPVLLEVAALGTAPGSKQGAQPRFPGCSWAANSLLAGKKNAGWAAWPQHCDSSSVSSTLRDLVPGTGSFQGDCSELLVHYMFMFAWSKMWDKVTSPDSDALPSTLHWLHAVFATHLKWTICLRFRISGKRLEGQFIKSRKRIRCKVKQSWYWTLRLHFFALATSKTS